MLNFISEMDVCIGLHAENHDSRSIQYEHILITITIKSLTVPKVPGKLLIVSDIRFHAIQMSLD